MKKPNMIKDLLQGKITSLEFVSRLDKESLGDEALPAEDLQWLEGLSAKYYASNGIDLNDLSPLTDQELTHLQEIATRAHRIYEAAQENAIKEPLTR